MALSTVDSPLTRVCGALCPTILALASPTNPKTSALTGHSMVAAARDGMAFRALDILRVNA